MSNNTNTITTTITLKEFKHLLVNVIYPHNVDCGKRGANASDYITPILYSDPGQGKTSVFAQAAAIHDAECHVVVPVSMDPVDAMGLPMTQQLQDGEFITKWATPDLIFRAPENSIILIDEATKSPPMLMNVFSQLIEEHRINLHRLRPGVTVGLCANHLSNRAGDQELPSHVQNRLMHFNIVNRADDVLEHAAEIGLATEVTGYIAWKKEAAFAFNPNSRVNPTPRSWFKVATQCHSKHTADLPAALRRAMIVGLIGEGPAGQYIPYLKARESLPHPEKIIADPTGTPVPGANEPGILWAVTSALTGHATIKNVGKIITYLNRIKATEFVVFAIKDMTTRNPQLNSVPDVLQWKMKNRHLFTPVL